MRTTWMSIALSGYLAVSAACTRTNTTSATDSHSALPAVNEMQIKRDLLEGRALPNAVELRVLRQTQRSDTSYLKYPTSLASSDDGDIYISDNNGDAIYHTTSTFKVLNKLLAEDGHLVYPKIQFKCVKMKSSFLIMTESKSSNATALSSDY